MQTVRIVTHNARDYSFPTQPPTCCAMALVQYNSTSPMLLFLCMCKLFSGQNTIDRVSLWKF